MKPARRIQFGGRQLVDPAQASTGLSAGHPVSVSFHEVAMVRKKKNPPVQKGSRPADKTGKRNEQPDANKYRIIPRSTEEHYQALRASIADIGPQVPVIRDSDGNLLDGSEREQACQELGIFCPTEVRKFASEKEKYELILALHCHRRKPPNQAEKRKLIAAYLIVDPEISDNWLAEIVGGVSKNTITDERHQLERAGRIPRLTRLRGKDGKRRPVNSTRIIANNPVELVKALESMKDVPNDCAVRSSHRSSSFQDRNDPPVLTSYKCDNDFLFAQVAKLYLRPGDRIADVTFGQGNFWGQIDTSQYDFHPSDVLTWPQGRIDFRRLPYQSASFDKHVFDPPYMHQQRGRPRQRIHGTNYRNAETTERFSHADIIHLYRDGMREGRRILRSDGLMFVKCQDEIEKGRQRMSHVEIHDIAAKELGMEVLDIFILTQPSPLLHFGRSPRFAKKNHSYLWVFKKPGDCNTPRSHGSRRGKGNANKTVRRKPHDQRV
jgi:DNA methylase